MNQSYWMDLQEGKHYPPLSKDVHIHTLIIGAGLSGLTTAYYLSSITSNVMIIEADEIGYGSSGRNTGKLSVQHGAIYHKLIQTHGKEIAKEYYMAQKEALESISAIIQEHHISCHYEEKSALLYTQHKENIAILQKEYEAYQTLGIQAQYVEESAYPFQLAAGIRIDHQAGYDPYAYLLGLSDYLDACGIAIYEHSPASLIQKDGNGWHVTVNDHSIYAQYIVSATMTPLLDAFSFFFAKTYPSISHLAMIKAYQECQGEMLYSIDDPMVSYHGINKAMMLCGGYAHEAGKGNQHDHDAWLSHVYETWKCEASEAVWDTQDLISYDHMPLIGSLSDRYPNFLIACGYGKWGNTNANVAAKILCSQILKQENRYASLFRPSRIAPLLQGKCFRMNLSTAMRFLKSQFPDFAEEPCAPLEGKCVSFHGQPYGMYCDENEEIYIVDIRCPHMGCICTFNEMDHTWDCPCHGSRFSYTGNIIKGPAQTPLSSHEEERNHVDPKLFVSKSDRT